MAKSFKSSLITTLEAQLSQQIPLNMTWDCTYCGGQHSGNLFKKVRAVLAAEQDIHLLDSAGLLFAAIHISNNKKPKTELAESYHRQGVISIQVAPGEDIERPRFVNTCLNPKCKKCAGFMQDKSMLIIDSKCWKCSSTMKVAMLDGHGYHPGPEVFTPEELTFAREHGVLIKSNYSSVRRESYLSNTCPACGKLTGDHYLFTEHYTSAMYGDYAYTSHPMGYYCEHCTNE
ncbi:hypothetical protein [Mucilaginibacter sp. UYCu711]|uniref:hypothetical protein n=1 Tax=Mucilaginibacter sp. UYCu711 TaxID=3156339 RepID=UPI003D255ADA